MSLFELIELIICIQIYIPPPLPNENKNTPSLRNDPVPIVPKLHLVVPSFISFRILSRRSFREPSFHGSTRKMVQKRMYIYIYIYIYCGRPLISLPATTNVTAKVRKMGEKNLRSDIYVNAKTKARARHRYHQPKNPLTSFSYRKKCKPPTHSQYP